MKIILYIFKKIFSILSLLLTAKSGEVSWRPAVGQVPESTKKFAEKRWLTAFRFSVKLTYRIFGKHGGRTADRLSRRDGFDTRAAEAHT